MKDNTNHTSAPFRGLCIIFFVACIFISIFGSALTPFTHFNFVNTHSCFFFTVIFLFLSLLFILHFLKSYNDGEEFLKKQKESFEDIRQQQEQIENRICTMDANVKEERYTLSIQSERQKNIYLKQLTDLRAVYTENLALFSHGNKKLYGILKKTFLYSIGQIKSMIDEYLKIANQ